MLRVIISGYFYISLFSSDNSIKLSKVLNFVFLRCSYISKP